MQIANRTRADASKLRRRPLPPGRTFHGHGRKLLYDTSLAKSEGIQESQEAEASTSGGIQKGESGEANHVMGRRGNASFIASSIQVW